MFGVFSDTKFCVYTRCCPLISCPCKARSNANVMPCSLGVTWAYLVISWLQINLTMLKRVECHRWRCVYAHRDFSTWYCTSAATRSDHILLQTHAEIHAHRDSSQSQEHFQVCSVLPPSVWLMLVTSVKPSGCKHWGQISEKRSQQQAVSVI